MPLRCAATLPPFSGKDIPMLIFLFNFVGGGMEDGLDAKDTCLGSLESYVSSGEISQ